MPDPFKFKSSINTKDEYCDNKLCWIVLIQQQHKMTHVSYQKCDSIDEAIENYQNKLLYAIQIIKNIADDFLHQLKTGNNKQKATRGIESKVATLKAYANIFSLRYFENNELTKIIRYNNNEKRKKKTMNDKNKNNTNINIGRHNNNRSNTNRSIPY